MQYELLLFAGVFFLLGALDDIVIDCTWLWLRVTNRGHTRVIERHSYEGRKLSGYAAVFIPAWREDRVIADTISHALSVWPQINMRLYVGCYCNDIATITAASAAGARDRRLRIVVLERPGPTTKADCLNRLYAALRQEELKHRIRFRMIVFHDAEDMVDPCALPLMDESISSADFVQLPVEPIPQSGRDWLGSHYCEEFAEDHGKALIVRDALEVGVPSAGVGCAISRDAVELLCARNDTGAPFATQSLTEDYEMGLSIAEMGGCCRFVRAKDRTGKLVATRAYFPASIKAVVRQKARWVHGIALQGWERVGWTGRPLEDWMRLRDRRGPLAALVLVAGYSLVVVSLVGLFADLSGFSDRAELSAFAQGLVIANLVAFAWRTLFRFGFTARSYGVRQGLLAVIRIPLTNLVAILSVRRAAFDYLRSLGGGAVRWEKTTHDKHPTQAIRMKDMKA